MSVYGAMDSNYHNGNEEGSEGSLLGGLCDAWVTEGSAWVDLNVAFVPRWMEPHTQKPFQTHYFFLRNMPCGTRFISFTLSEQLFLMLSYFSCRIENC